MKHPPESRQLVLVHSDPIDAPSRYVPVDEPWPPSNPERFVQIPADEWEAGHRPETVAILPVSRR